MCVSVCVRGAQPQRRLSLREKGSFGFKYWEVLLPAHLPMMPKVNEACVSGCRTLCAHLCSCVALTTDEPEKNSAETQGQGQVGLSVRVPGSEGTGGMFVFLGVTALHWF